MAELKTPFFKIHYEKGSVRWMKSGTTEIIRMIYAAVRDHNWGTIEPEIAWETVSSDDMGFQVEARLIYKKNNIHFESVHKITAWGNRLVFELEGKAHSSFMSNRVGFCVLHPVKECVGKNCLIFHPDGTAEQKIFPEEIAATQPMKNIWKMEWKPDENIQVKLTFSGDVFEMEDQRNWTDASWKTYCRPLDLPFPFEITAGTEIIQKIELEISSLPVLKTPEGNTVEFKIDKNRIFKLPEIGVSGTSRMEPLMNEEAETLKSFSFGHLRAELKLFRADWKADFYKALEESMVLEVPLFLVIYFSENYTSEMIDLKSTVPGFHFRVKYILVVGKNHLPNDTLFENIYTDLKNIFPEVKIGTGVNAWFAELNRNQPRSENADFISFAVCPQVHASDDATLVENLEAQRYVMESAKKIFPGKPVFISPLTLKQRFNVVATSEEPSPQQGELPSPVDARQNSVFAAQWLLGSLKFLAQSGADLVTCFETVGWRGFIQGNFYPPLPENFSARKGDIFPCFQLLKELKDFDEVIHSESSLPLKTDGIVFLHRNKNRILIALLANFQLEDIKIKLTGNYVINSIQSLIPSLKTNWTNNEMTVPGRSIVRVEIKHKTTSKTSAPPLLT